MEMDVFDSSIRPLMNVVCALPMTENLLCVVFFTYAENTSCNLRKE